MDEPTPIPGRPDPALARFDELVRSVPEDVCATARAYEELAWALTEQIAPGGPRTQLLAALYESAQRATRIKLDQEAWA